jgi:glucosamine-6-phosphate deaminase
MPTVVVDLSPADVGRMAARHAATVLRQAVAHRGNARVMFASAPSQQDMLVELLESDVPWDRVEAFHIDEYVGIDPQSEQAFGRWLAIRLFDRLPLTAHLIDPAGDPASEAQRYGALLRAAPIDLACLGIGVNGHLAFNEPYQWLIDDPLAVREIVLDEVSRQQQVDDGCFATLGEVPVSALTVTIPQLLEAATVIVTATGTHKAAAVAGALSPGITAAIPASVLQKHADAHLYVDTAAVAGLDNHESTQP